MGDGEAVDVRELDAAGWRRRSVASEPRLSELVEMYRSLGYEVRLVAVDVAGVAEDGTRPCAVCFEADETPGRSQVIYTRPGPGSGEEATRDRS